MEEALGSPQPRKEREEGREGGREEKGLGEGVPHGRAQLSPAHARLARACEWRLPLLGSLGPGCVTLS